VTSLLPYPADSGSRIRGAQFVRMLAKHHEVAVLSLEDGDAAAASRAHTF